MRSVVPKGATSPWGAISAMPPPRRRPKLVAQPLPDDHGFITLEIPERAWRQLVHQHRDNGEISRADAMHQHPRIGAILLAITYPSTIGAT